MNTNKKTVYVIEINIPENPTQYVTIKDKITFGEDGNCDVCLEGFELEKVHCAFRLHNEVLSLHNIAGNNIYIGKQQLNIGKMYIIQKGDNIKMGSVEVLVTEKEVTIENLNLPEEMPSEDETQDTKDSQEISLEEDQQETKAPQEEMTLEEGTQEAKTPQEEIVEKKVDESQDLPTSSKQVDEDVTAPCLTIPDQEIEFGINNEKEEAEGEKAQPDDSLSLEQKSNGPPEGLELNQETETDGSTEVDEKAQEKGEDEAQDEEEIEEEVEEETPSSPKRKSFLSKLFGKKKKQTDDESEVKKEKKSFLGKLFKKRKKEEDPQPEVEEIEETDQSEAVESNDTLSMDVTEGGDNQELTLTDAPTGKIDVSKEGDESQEIEELPDKDKKEAPKKGFFAKLFGRKKKKETRKRIYNRKKSKRGFWSMFSSKKVKKKPTIPRSPRLNNKQGQSQDGKPPGIFIRLVSFITSVFIAYTVLYIILPFFALDSEADEIINDIVKVCDDLISNPHKWYMKLISLVPKDIVTIPKEVIEIIPEDLSLKKLLPIDLIPAKIKSFFAINGLEIIRFYLVLVAIDIVSALLLGISIPLFFLGIRIEGTFLGQRIRAFFRSIFGLITTPFIIFDIPALFSKRTVKEVLSFSHPYCAHKFIRFIGVMLFIPLILLSCVLSPLITDIKLTTELATHPWDVTHKKASFKFQSLDKDPNFKLDPKEKKKIIFLPSIKRLGRKKSHSILVYNVKKNIKTKINLNIRINYIKLLEMASKGNPLLSTFYPAIDKLNRKKESNKFISASIKTEMTRLLRSAFDSNIDIFNINNIQEYFLNNGPFILGIVSIRNHLFKTLNLPFYPRIDFVTFKQTKMIRFASKLLPKGKDIYLLSLEGLKPLLIKISTAKKNRDLSKAFLSNYVNKRKKKGGWDGISLIEQINNLRPKGKNRVELANKILKYYKSMMNFAKKERSQSHQRLVKNSIQETITYIQKFNVKSDDSVINPLVNKLKRLK